MTGGMRGLLLVVLAACGTPNIDPASVPRDPASDGPWRVGVRTLDGPDGAIEVWYPATPDDDAEPEVTLGIPSAAVRGAPVDARGGPFPLVAFSHGRGGIRVQSVYLTVHLASWGYVVVAPDHPHDTLGSSNDDAPAVLRARPHQISAAIDAALASDLATIIDDSRIGATGHSFGAFTVLVLAGARLDVAALRDACAADPDQLACSGLDDQLTQAVADDFVDHRIAAAVALAPAGRIAFGASGLTALAVPIQIQGGSADTLATADGEIHPIFDGLTARPRSLGVLDRAAHFSFTDICVLYEATGGASGPLGFLATEGCGPDTLPIERAHAASRTLATAFLDLALRGAPDSNGYLTGVPDLDSVELIAPTDRAPCGRATSPGHAACP
jgi:predicted dienelactone hydrolase